MRTSSISIEELKRHPFFAALPGNAIQTLLDNATRKIYRKGEYVLHQDEIWKKALYLHSGLMEWTILSPSGKRQVVFRVRAGEMVWGHTLFDEQGMPAALEVMSDSDTLLWTEEKIRPILETYPKATLEVAGELVRAMRRVRELVYGFAFHPVAGRLARLLIHHYQPTDGHSVPRDLTLDEMAHSVGTTRELVSKTLHRFASEGIIHVNRVELTFLDKDKLERIAKDS